VHKGAWLEAGKDDPLAAGHLDAAIDAYRRGFTADPRDAYPGVNLLTLLDVRGDSESLAEKDQLLPVVTYAAKRRLAGNKPGYWDHATQLELAVLAGDWTQAQTSARRALSAVDEGWQAQTTLTNLRLIEEAHAARGEPLDRLAPITEAFARRTGSGSVG
jgi:hypothetical protein